MTTLEKIVKEAKEIKKNYPKKFAKWTDYIKEASKKLKGSFTKKKTNIGKIKKYDLGFASKGSGTIVYNRLKQEYGDYENIAHISDFGLITIYDKKMPESVKKEIEIYNKKSMLGATKKTKITKKPIKYNDVSKRQSDIIRKEIKSKKFIMPHGYEVRRSKLNGNSIGSINDKYITELNNINKEIENAKENINSLKTLKRNNLKDFKLGFKQELLDRYINRTKYLKNQLIQIKKQIK